MKAVLVFAALALSSGCATMQGHAWADVPPQPLQCHPVSRYTASSYINPLHSTGPVRIVLVHPDDPFVVTSSDGQMFECRTTRS